MLEPSQKGRAEPIGDSERGNRHFLLSQHLAEVILKSLCFDLHEGIRRLKERTNTKGLGWKLRHSPPALVLD